MATKLVISGCCGRMGERIASLALGEDAAGNGGKDSAFAIGAALEARGHEAVGRDFGTVLGRPSPLGVSVVDDARMALGQGDVLIDFSTPPATVEHVRLAEELRKPAVIGTTGLDNEQFSALRQASKNIAIVFSPNMSRGVNVLFELARTATERLGHLYDVEVVESHHRRKKDAPSGTAKRLADVIASVLRKQPREIPVHAIRAGEIVGDHTLIFAGPSERLELTHRAQSRDVFAQGALAAALFVRRQSPGLYDVSDVLKAGG